MEPILLIFYAHRPPAAANSHLLSPPPLTPAILFLKQTINHAAETRQEGYDHADQCDLWSSAGKNRP